jgi:Lar family restriction alleviation protein
MNQHNDFQKNEELKPCPFCGSERVEYESGYSYPEHHISCLGCGIAVFFDVDWTEEQATTHWNTRQSPAAGTDGHFLAQKGEK